MEWVEREWREGAGGNRVQRDGAAAGGPAAAGMPPDFGAAGCRPGRPSAGQGGIGVWVCVDGWGVRAGLERACEDRRVPCARLSTASARRSPSSQESGEGGGGCGHG